jgi:hypothetical protein
MQARRYMTMTFAAAAILTIILLTGAGATDNATVESPEAVEKSSPPATAAEGSTDPAKVVAAVVNGTEITMAPVIEEMNRVGQLFIRRQGRVPSADETAQIKKEALDSVIFLELAHGFGRKHFTVEPVEVDGMVAQLRQRLSHLYEEYLQDKGFTEETLRLEIERRLLIQKSFAQEVDARAGFDEEEARKEYAAQPELFTIPARIEVDDLFIASGADKEGAAARAAALATKRGKESNSPRLHFSRTRMPTFSGKRRPWKSEGSPIRWSWMRAIMSCSSAARNPRNPFPLTRPGNGSRKRPKENGPRCGWRS